MAQLPKLELRYHNAMPNWVKIKGLKIKAIPEWEGGGFAIDKEQGEAIMAALYPNPDPNVVQLTNQDGEVVGYAEKTRETHPLSYISPCVCLGRQCADPTYLGCRVNLERK